MNGVDPPGAATAGRLWAHRIREPSDAAVGLRLRGVAVTGVPYVAVVGSDGASAGEPELTVAWEVGRALARRGAVVVCGGLFGVMEAACRGAREAGGSTVGLLPGLDRSEANAHLTVALPTGLGEARNVLVVRAADAVVAVGGEFGTLSEIALALKAGTPVVGVDTWELAKGGVAIAAIDRAGGAEEAVERALALAAR